MAKLLPTFEQLTGAILDPAPSWRWIVIMPTITATGAISSPVPSIKGQNQTEALNTLQRAQLPAFSVLSASIPTQMLDSDQRFYSGTREPFPRFISTGELSINFYVDCQYNAMRYITNWLKFIRDDDGNYSPRNLYAADFNIYFYDTTDTDWKMQIVVRQAFPTQPSPISSQYSSGELVDYSCSFAATEVDTYFQS